MHPRQSMVNKHLAYEFLQNGSNVNFPGTVMVLSKVVCRNWELNPGPRYLESSALLLSHSHHEAF